MNEERKIKRREYYIKNREQCKAKNEEWRQRNLSKVLEARKLRYEQNREKELKQIKEYRLANPELVKQQRRAARIKGREWRKVYIKERCAKDPVFRIGRSLRSRLSLALNGINKSASTIALLGCHPNELKVYLEKQFTSEMNWDNYGTNWHIDHIIPVCSFDLTKPEEQARCFNYTNLRPLNAIENMLKGAKIGGTRKSAADEVKPELIDVRPSQPLPVQLAPP